MSHLCSPTLCTACGACINACPFKAIEWRENSFAEQIPFISNALCKDCGACDRVCPQLAEMQGNLPVKSYACWHKSADDLAKSASGGAARALSQAVIEKGGIVFGCAFSEGRNHHKAVTSIDGLDELSGSKYVWSDVEYCYQNVRDCLRNQANRPVLFIGTPCQVDGLKHFLGELCDSPSLFTADLICHGTPPPSYIKNFLKNTEGDEPERLVCRDRSGGALHGVLKNGREFHYSGGFDCSMYLQAFVRGITYRERCYSCRYAMPRRVGDITLGDYWGISQKYLPADAPELLSIVYVNTEQGRKLFDSASSLLEHHPVPPYDAAIGKTNMIHPQKRPAARDAFLKFLPEKGFTEALRLVLHPAAMSGGVLKENLRESIKNAAKHVCQLAYSMFFRFDSCEVLRKEKLVCITTGDEASLCNDYGLFFQYYALKTIFEKHGYQVYRQDRLLIKNGTAWDNGGKWMKTLPLVDYFKEVIGKLRHRSIGACRLHRLFRKSYSRLMSPFFEYSKAPADICIIGGDMVFHTRSEALDMFRDNAADTACKIAFAASGNWNSCASDALWQLRAREVFPMFKAFSVRGEKGVEICQKLAAVPIFKSIDPILLLTRKDYGGIMPEERFWSGKTLLCYMDGMENFKTMAADAWSGLAKKLSVNLKLTGRAFTDNCPKGLQNNVFLPSPEDFLRAVRDADFVVTDCCQGVAFALLFEKQFACVCKDANVEMVQDVLKNIDILDRMQLMSNAETLFSLLKTEINWPVVGSKVEAWRLESLKWLEDACKR